MARVLKFRAWDGKKMTTMRGIQLNGIGELFAYSENFKIMQFTGLLDKNGKEIYEGDILEVPTRGKNVWRCVVEFEDGGFKAKPTIDPEDDFELIDVVDCPVIGNIYENTELLMA